MLIHDRPQCIETNAAMFAYELQCKKQNSWQLSCLLLSFWMLPVAFTISQKPEHFQQSIWRLLNYAHRFLCRPESYFCTVPCVWQQGADTPRSPSAPLGSGCLFLLLDWFLLPAWETPNSPNSEPAAQPPDKGAHTHTHSGHLMMNNYDRAPPHMYQVLKKTAVTKKKKITW